MNLNSSSDLLQGAEGRKWAIIAGSSAANPLVKVQSTVFEGPDRFVHSALIENLVIDGNDQNVTGILLENVGQCQIRNVTIKNCDVGIHLKNVEGWWSECNFLKHIRMENVKTGIKFTGSQKISNYRPGDSAAFTMIDDVDISLVNNSAAVGIQIGDGVDLIKPYSSYLKASIKLGSAGGTGLKVLNGEFKFGLGHLTVMGPSSGIGVFVDSNSSVRRIWRNQFSEYTSIQGQEIAIIGGFMLVTSGISTPIQPSTAITDIRTIQTTL
jgi:hypothetical protein